MERLYLQSFSPHFFHSFSSWTLPVPYMCIYYFEHLSSSPEVYFILHCLILFPTTFNFPCISSGSVPISLHKKKRLLLELCVTFFISIIWQCQYLTGRYRWAGTDPFSPVDPPQPAHSPVLWIFKSQVAPIRLHFLAEREKHVAMAVWLKPTLRHTLQRLLGIFLWTSASKRALVQPRD